MPIVVPSSLQIVNYMFPLPTSVTAPPFAMLFTRQGLVVHFPQLRTYAPQVTLQKKLHFKEKLSKNEETKK